MYSISSTSALILLWTDKCVDETPLARKFLECISLDAAVPLSQAFAPFLKDVKAEVINRKFGIKKSYNDFLTSSPDSQVVVLGAGLDPKSLEVAEKFSSTLVFDVDMENMELKEEITKSIKGPKNIKFCKANLGDSHELMSSLEESGWDRNKTTFIIAEGISYYVSKELFKRALLKLRHPKGGLVVEYTVPDEEVFPIEMRPLVKGVFDTLQEKLGLPNPVERYGIKEIKDLADGLEGRVIWTFNQKQLEKERQGQGNTFHLREKSGYIHVSFIRFD